MKLQMILAAMAVFTLSNAFASQEAQDGTLAWKTKRIRCQNTSSYDPYVEVRGSLQYNVEQGQSQGSLKINLKSGMPNNQSVRVIGNYVKQRGMEFADLRVTDSMSDIDYIYIDFTDTTYMGRSNMSTRGGGYFKMACTTY
jgi:hypothetical protein